MTQGILAGTHDEDIGNVETGLVSTFQCHAQAVLSTMHEIISALKWREVQTTPLCKGAYNPIFEARCKELGMTIAASLDNNLY